jgi:hypothetical protein
MTIGRNIRLRLRIKLNRVSSVWESARKRVSWKESTVQREDLRAWSWRISTIRSHCQGTAVMTEQAGKGLMDVVVICELWTLAMALQLIVVPSRVDNRSINAIIKSKTPSRVTPTRDNRLQHKYMSASFSFVHPKSLYLWAYIQVHTRWIFVWQKRVAYENKLHWSYILYNILHMLDYFDKIISIIIILFLWVIDSIVQAVAISLPSSGIPFDFQRSGYCCMY